MNSFNVLGTSSGSECDDLSSVLLKQSVESQHALRSLCPRSSAVDVWFGVKAEVACTGTATTSADVRRRALNIFLCGLNGLRLFSPRHSQVHILLGEHVCSSLVWIQ